MPGCLKGASFLYWGDGMGTKKIYKIVIDKALAHLATNPPLHPAVGRYGPDVPPQSMSLREYCRHCR